MAKKYPKKKYTFEFCLTDAKKYKTRKDWQLSSSAAYKITIKNGWHIQCCSHMIGGKVTKWTKEECLKSAKKCKTRSEWCKKYNGAWYAARRNGWLDECYEYMLKPGKIRIIYTLDFCKGEAKKYKSRSEWLRKSRGSYYAAVNNKWLTICTTHMFKPHQIKIKWTKETCIESAKPFNNRSAWKKKFSQAYQVARINGWLEECCKHMLPPMEIKQIHTLASCKEKAKKFKTRAEWGNKDPGSYQAACLNQWLDDCCSHMLSRSAASTLAQTYWTKERCIKSAKKYKTKTEWRTFESSACEQARLQGWYEECCQHMPECASGVLREVKEAHPQYEKLFTELSLPFKYEQNIEFGRIDFIIETKIGFVGLEIKHDKSRWNKEELKLQLWKYIKSSKNTGLPLIGIILSFPQR